MKPIGPTLALLTTVRRRYLAKVAIFAAFALLLLAGIPGIRGARLLANTPNLTTQASSSWSSSRAPGYAVDGWDDNTSAWCAARQAGEYRLNGQLYHDWWEADFAQPRGLGAIHMKSGLVGPDRGYKITNFIWAYKPAQAASDSAPWIPLESTRIIANRSQLILRLPQELKGVAKLRLFINREETSAEITSPCLREVTFYDNRSASIPVKPWFYAVWTDQSYGRFEKARYTLYDLLNEAMMRITNETWPDVEDTIWLGDLDEVEVVEAIGSAIEEQESDGSHRFVRHLPESKTFSRALLLEPRPAGIFLSGTLIDYEKREPGIASGFYHLIREAPRDVPILGACGGHQVMAMAGANSTYEGFSKEFGKTAEKPNRVVVKCSNEFGLSDPEICAERSFRAKLSDGYSTRIISPNLPAYAAPLPSGVAHNKRDDLLLMGLNPSGASVPLSHYDLVRPETVAADNPSILPFFDIIATYARYETPKYPTYVQAMRLQGERDIYGTQFHWDAYPGGIDTACREGPRDAPGVADRAWNMGMVFDNFLLLSLDLLGKGRARFADKEDAALSDRNLATQSCGTVLQPEVSVTIDFDVTTPVRLLYVAGAQPDLEYSLEGLIPLQGATSLRFTHRSLSELTGPHCRGYRDDRYQLLAIDSITNVIQLKVTARTKSGAPACLSEVGVLGL